MVKAGYGLDGKSPPRDPELFTNSFAALLQAGPSVTLKLSFFLLFLTFFFNLFHNFSTFFLTSRSYVLSAPVIYTAKSVTFGGWEK